jgi:hypothetical protein
MSESGSPEQAQEVARLKAVAISLSASARRVRQGTDEALAAERRALAAWEAYRAARGAGDKI